MSEISIINVEKDYSIKDNETRINIKNINNKIGNWSNPKTISEEIQDIEDRLDAIQPANGCVKTVNTLTPDSSGNVTITASDIGAAAEQDLTDHVNKLGTATEAGHVKVINEIKIGEDAPEYNTEGSAASPAAVQALAQSLSLEIDKKMDKGEVIQQINSKGPNPDGNIVITGDDILYNTEGETLISITQKINEVEQKSKIEANPEIPEEVVEIDLTDIKIGDEYYKIKGSGGEGGTNVIANPEGEPTDDLKTIQIEDTIYKVSDDSIEPNPEEESTDTLEKIKIKDTVYDLKAGSNVTPNPEEEATISLKKIKIEDATYSIDGGVTSVQVGDGEKQTGDVVITLPKEKNEVYIGKDETEVPDTIEIFIDESEDYEGQDGGGQSSKHKYSTEEQIIGTWIDNKPVYEKTIICNALTSDGLSVVLYSCENDNIKCLINMECLYGYFTDSSADNTLLSGFYGDSLYMNASTFTYLVYENQSIVLKRNNNITYSGRIPILTFQYTKTID